MLSWLPSFLNPATASLAAAIAAPLLLLLYFLKLRRREQSVSSTLLWKKAIQDLQVNSPFQRLRKNLLLLLQMLLLLLLCLALARPVINHLPAAGQLTVILIDRSASMSAKDQPNGKTRLDVAKDKAREIVASMDRNASACIIVFDDSAETLQGFTSDGSALRRAIDSISPTDRPTRLKLAYQLAEAQAQFDPNQNRPNSRPDVFLFSDGRVEDAADLRLTANLRFVPIGTKTAANIGIVSLSAKRNYEQPTQVQIFARLANFGPTVVDTQVQLSVATIDPAKPGELKFVARPGGFTSATLLPANWTDAQKQAALNDPTMKPRDSVEFNFELTTAAVIKVEQKTPDVLPADDSAVVVIPPPKQLEVLEVSDGQDPYLDLALGSLRLQGVKKMSPQEYASTVPNDFDVIVFDRYSPASLPQAGSFVYFDATPPADVKLQPMREDGVVQTSPDARVVDWRRDHPILHGLNLSRVGATESIRLQMPLDAQSLVDGVSGPLVVTYREARRTHVVVAFDLLQSNWPLQQSFPVFMQQLVQYLAIGSETNVRQALSPGATPRIPRANLQRLGAEPTSVRLIGPDGSRTVPVPPTGDFALPALDHVGLYTLDPPVPQFERMAINLLDDSESNLLPVEQPPGNIGQALVGQANQSRMELWWWIIAWAALPLLMIEWVVYTKRVGR